MQTCKTSVMIDDLAWRFQPSTNNRFSPRGATARSVRGYSHYRGFTITLRQNTLSRTPLDEWLGRRRGLYLTKYDTHNRQTSILPAGFEPANPASKRPQTHALERAATGIGQIMECYTTDRTVRWKFLDYLCECGFLKDLTPCSHLATGRWIQI